MAAACKDVMACYVKQLLELDEDRRRATLESLSKYDLRDLEWTAAHGVAPDSQAPQKVMHFSTLPNAGKTDPKLEPATIALPPGLATSKGLRAGVPTYMPVDAEGVAVQEVDDEEISLSRVVTPPLSRSEEGEKSAHAKQLVGILDKALSDLTSGLSPEVAGEAQRVLAQTVRRADGAEQPRAKGQDLEAMRWLMRHLERQQEASARKLEELLGMDASRAGSWAEGSPGQPLPPQGLSELLGMQGLPGQPLPTQGLGAGGLGAGTPGAAAAAGVGALGAAAAVGYPLEWGRLAATRACATGAGLAPPTHGLPWWSPAPGAAARAPVAQQARAAGRQAGVQRMPGGVPWQQRAPAVETAGGAGEQHCAGETLRMHLRSLIQIDSGRILIVRKINRLGFASSDLLKQHYSWYGSVERVLVAHSRVKYLAVATPSREARAKFPSRWRPSALGFVVMSTTEEAEAILAGGLEQMVYGVKIRVQQFERRQAEADADNENENDNGDLTPDTNSSEEQQSA